MSGGARRRAAPCSQMYLASSIDLLSGSRGPCARMRTLRGDALQVAAAANLLCCLPVDSSGLPTCLPSCLLNPAFLSAAASALRIPLIAVTACEELYLVLHTSHSGCCCCCCTSRNDLELLLPVLWEQVRGALFAGLDCSSSR
jgi:hypothetical protein